MYQFWWSVLVQMQLQPSSQHKLQICSLWMKKACTPKQCRKEGETKEQGCTDQIDHIKADQVFARCVWS